MNQERRREEDDRPYPVLVSGIRFPACMGGACAVRDNCARYHQADRAEPAERLCRPLRSNAWEPITLAASDLA